MCKSGWVTKLRILREREGVVTKFDYENEGGGKGFKNFRVLFSDRARAKPNPQYYFFYFVNPIHYVDN
jgi:hypothetical protein